MSKDKSEEFKELGSPVDKNDGFEGQAGPGPVNRGEEFLGYGSRAGQPIIFGKPSLTKANPNMPPASSVPLCLTEESKAAKPLLYIGPSLHR